MTTSMQQWQQANKHYLLTHLDRIKGLLQQSAQTRQQEPVEVVMQHQAPAALDHLASWFQLSAFERDIVLLCAGVELDREFMDLLATAQGNPSFTYPTFRLALTLLPEAHWSALSPERPLRHWNLIEVEAGRIITLNPLRIDERILHYLLGVEYLDTSLSGIFQPLALHHTPLPSQEQIAQEIAAVWTLAAKADERVPAIQLCGSEMGSQRDIAMTACSLLNHQAFLVSAALLPTQPIELHHLLHVWQRELLLGNHALVLDIQKIDPSDSQREQVIAQIIEANRGLLLVIGREQRVHSHPPLLTLTVDKPTRAEQRVLWQQAAGDQAQALNGTIDKLCMQFHLSSEAITTIWSTSQAQLADASTPQAMSDTLWDVCRKQAHPYLGDLAEHIEPVATWTDLILPEAQCSVLRDIALHVRQRTRVYENWGFLTKGARGLGISALFAGASGVGKTMAAEVLAQELHLDLYRIDLSAVVSKYIGETEKNLRRVFDAAEGSSVILLFDEADALFGKRSDVKDSHDRYANIEISYLLQRMEAYRGLAILTTNMKDALDQAFLRRLRFIVQFPFPDISQRAEIWRQIFPEATPTQNLDRGKLAQLNAAGGTIRNIALHAAFIAADQQEAVSMSHILQATRYEYAKLEKSLTLAEIQGWETNHAHPS